MKEVFATWSPVESQFVRGLLENAGIAAVVRTDSLFARFAERTDTLPRVYVLDAGEVRRAGAFIAGREAGRSPRA